MIKFFPLLTFMLLSSISNAQLFNNKFNIYLGCSFGDFNGTEIINDDDYISPALYPNYKNLMGYSAKGLVNKTELLSYGLDYSYMLANRWNAGSYDDFDDSQTRIYSFAPLIRIHSKFRENGLFNRIQIFLETGPEIGISSLTLTREIYDIHSQENSDFSHPMNDKNIFWGIKGTIGLDFSIAQDYGCFISYSHEMNRVSSKLYNDHTLNCSLVNIGFAMKLNKDKYLYY